VCGVWSGVFAIEKTVKEGTLRWGVMAYFEDEDVVQEALLEEYELRIDDGVLLEALIDSLGEKEYNEMRHTVQAVNRAYRVQSTDIVGDDRMLGARVSFVDTDGDAHRAIVMEPHVEELGTMEAYDPQRDEMVDPSTYPMGTVQLIHAEDGEFGDDDFFFDRPDDLAIKTSVTPAKGPDAKYTYFAGWDLADEERDGE